MNLELIAALGLVIYALTFLLASSKAFEGWREWLGEWLDAFWPEREYKMEECRMCMGVWITLVFFLVAVATPFIAFRDGLQFFAAYGLSYFMATQERP